MEEHRFLVPDVEGSSPSLSAMIKRYLLFDGDNYYPAGGIHDYVRDFDTIEEAKDYVTYDCDWVQIVDHETMEQVAFYWLLGVSNGTPKEKKETLSSFPLVSFPRRPRSCWKRWSERLSKMWQARPGR